MEFYIDTKTEVDFALENLIGKFEKDNANE